MTDYILQELREIRESHAAQFDYDLERIHADLQARQARHAADGWTVIPAPAHPSGILKPGAMRAYLKGEKTIRF